MCGLSSDHDRYPYMYLVSVLFTPPDWRQSRQPGGPKIVLDHVHVYNV